MCIFLQCLHCDHLWTSLWKLLPDCTSTLPDYCSADVFTGRHISSYNMVQFECLITCVQCSHCSCITLWHVVMPPIARGQTWLCQPLPVSTVPNTGRNISNSNCQGLDEEEERLIFQGYGNVTSMQFTVSYYRCYTVLRVPAILRYLFCRQFGNIHFDSLSCWLVYSVVTVHLRD